MHQRVLVARPHRREAHATVAGDDGGSAQGRRGRHARIPGDLAVVVRVDVDPTRRDDETRGVDLLAALGRDGPDLNDAIALDGDVSMYGRAALAVEHQPSANDYVCHWRLPQSCGMMFELIRERPRRSQARLLLAPTWRL